MITKSEQGFSLIELLVVMAFIGILLSIGALTLGRAIEQGRLNEASQTLGETLKVISQEAISSSQEITVTITSQGLSWLTESGQSRSLSLPNSATLSSSRSSFTYSGRGFPIEGAVSFSIKRNEKTRAVNLFATGSVVYP